LDLFEAVIFDWDGTLADTRKVIVASFHKALRETLNLDVADEFIERRIGVGAADTFREILREKGIPIDEDLIKRLLKVKIQVQISLAGEVELFAGARELLDALNGKVKVALASMNNREVISHMLNALRVKDYFSVVITRDEVSKSKPNPEIFLKSALKLKTPPEKCVVVEDSIFGVEAAKTGKMGCIAVLTGVYSKEELSKANPDLIVVSLQEKSEIVQFIIS
jgi:HAD superfamily hydrolase (TIGR01509 family)